MPHNSLLGVLAFSGLVGFAGTWQVVPVAAYFHGLVYRRSRAPIPRIAAMSGLLTLMMVTIQVK